MKQYFCVAFLFTLLFALAANADETEKKNPKHFRIEVTVTAKSIRTGNITVNSGYARPYTAPTDALHITVLNRKGKPIHELSLYDPLLLRIYDRRLLPIRVVEPEEAHTHELSEFVEQEGSEPIRRKPLPAREEEVQEKYERIPKADFVVFVPFDPDADSLQLTYHGKKKIAATVSLAIVIREYCKSSADPDCNLN